MGRPYLNVFLQGLREHGYEDRKSIDIAYRWANGDSSRLPLLAKELVALDPNLILSATGPGNVALMQSTASIPIVGALTVDPVKLGLAVSHNRPGRNFTGVLVTLDGLPGKQAEFLLQLLPRATALGVLINPDSPTNPFVLRDINSALQGKPIRITQAFANKPTDLPAAFDTLKHEGVGGVVIPSDNFFFSVVAQIVSLSETKRLPVVYDRREHVERGGLISYGVAIPQNFRRSADFVDRILKGSKPSELPIEFPTKLELAINLKTAKALGIEVPSSLAYTADEVIE
jgi:putative ABC transport system substrate-binding protein